jgi:hypothetical protein
MTTMAFFQCDRRRIECRIDSEALAPNAAAAMIQYCPDSKGIAVCGKVTRLQERRCGLWVEVQRWIDVA